MWRPTTFDAAVGLGAVAGAGALTVLESQGLPELLFYSTMLMVAAHLVRSAFRAGRLARRERERAAELVGTPPDAWRSPPSRTNGDGWPRTSRRPSASSPTGSSPKHGRRRRRPECGAARIHEESQRATSELRRHLGLLRQPTEATPLTRRGSSGTGRAPRRDLVLGATTTALAAVESAAYSATEGPADWSWWSVALSALAGATVVGRTVALPRRP